MLFYHFFVISYQSRIEDVKIMLYTSDSSEKAVALHSSTFAWRISWTEDRGGLLSKGSQESDITEATEHASVRAYFVNRYSFDTY